MTHDVVSKTLTRLRELEESGAVTLTSLDLPADTSYERMEALFAYLGAASHTLRWLLGDLVCWGEGVYGDRVYQAAEASGLAEGTLQNYASVCGRIAPDRRDEALSFSIHREVAYLEPPAQVEWLERAKKDGLSVKKLRDLLSEAGLRGPQSEPQWSPGGTASLPPAASTGPEGGAARHPNAVLLATMRDELEEQVTMTSAYDDHVAECERRRDALNWALEALDPELA